MPITVFKTKFEKPIAKEVIYRDYKNYNPDNFKRDLISAFANGCDDYDTFERLFLDVLEAHAPLKKKFIRANHAPYMTKKT